MSITISADTPQYLLKQTCETSKDFVKLNFKPRTIVKITKNTLLQEVKKVKNPKSLLGSRVDGYIREMKLRDHPIPFFKLKSNDRNKTYLSTKYFTIGLLQVPSETVHVIQNEAESGSIYAYRCLPDNIDLYRNHVNSRKALINRDSIIAHFDPIDIKPGKDHTMEPHTIYFFYSVTHCKCTWIRISGREYHSMMAQRGSQLNLRSKTHTTNSSRRSTEAKEHFEDSANLSSLHNHIKYLEHELEFVMSKNKSLEEENEKLLKAVEESRRCTTHPKIKRMKVEPEDNFTAYEEESQGSNESTEHLTEMYCSVSPELSTDFQVQTDAYGGDSSPAGQRILHTTDVPQTQQPVSAQRDERSLIREVEDQRKKIAVLTHSNKRSRDKIKELENELDNLKSQYAEICSIAESTSSKRVINNRGRKINNFSGKVRM